MPLKRFLGAPACRRPLETHVLCSVGHRRARNPSSSVLSSWGVISPTCRLIALGKVSKPSRTRGPHTGAPLPWSSGMRVRANWRPCTCAMRSRRSAAAGSARRPRPSARRKIPVPKYKGTGAKVPCPAGRRHARGALRAGSGNLVHRETALEPTKRLCTKVHEGEGRGCCCLEPAPLSPLRLKENAPPGARYGLL